MENNSKQHADKGCRKCDRRRIRCDRTLPQCSKCTLRGFLCPGYDRSLKFICGAASKGPNRQDFFPSEVEVSDHRPSVPRPSTAIAAKDIAHSSFAINPILPSSIQLQEQGLLDHFFRVVSNQLAWYNDGSNPWCHLIPPLAMQSPSVFSAMLGLAASNVVSRLCNNSPDKGYYVHIMFSYREQAFALLAKDLEAIRSSLDPSLRSQKSLPSAAVASILLLSFLEVNWPASGMWRTHLVAAKKVYDIFKPTINCNPTGRFLTEELLAASTWPLLTSYNSDSPFSNVDFTSGQFFNMEDFDSHLFAFTGFLRILRQIALIERQYGAQVKDVRTQDHINKIFRHVQLALWQARTSALTAISSKMFFHPNSHGGDMKHLIDAYFYATKIYSYRALLESDFNHDILLDLRTQLFQSLLAFENPDSFAQNQPWPLFVAGTESTNDAVGQGWFEHRLNSIIQLYGALDRPRMHNFLRDFWAQSEETNWIKFARKWTKDQCEFLIL